MSQEIGFKWVEELGSELEDRHFSYPVKRDPDAVKTLVTAAIYRTLSGHEVSSREQNRFIADSMNIQDEETEIFARGLMDQVRNILSERNGYQFEWDEARQQGEKASKAIEEGRNFSASYDYWQMRPVKSNVNIYKLDEHPESVILSCSLPEIGELLGLPYNLLSRDVTMEGRKRGQAVDAPFDFFMKVAAGLKNNPQDVLQTMYDKRQNMVFVQAMNDIGHTKFDKIRTAIVYSGDRDFPTYSTEDQWAMLSKKEREIAQKPRSERLNGDLKQPIEFGGNDAVLDISLWTEGDVWFDPRAMAMTGKIKQGEHDALYARLSPTIVPDFTHENYLQIRRQAQKLVKELGFPEKKSIRWY